MAIKQYRVKQHWTVAEMIKQWLEIYQQVKSSWWVMLLNKIMVAKKGKQISVYPKMDAEEVSHDQIETK